MRTSTSHQSLRIRNWIDFRNPERFEESFLELIGRLREEPIRRGRGGLTMTTSTTPAPFSPGPVVITSNNGPDVVTEQLVTKRAYATFINDAPIGTSFTVQIQATNGGIATTPPHHA